VASLEVEGGIVQTSTEGLDVAGFAVTLVVVEAAMTVTTPEVSATLSVP